MAGDPQHLHQIPWYDPAAFLEFLERHADGIGGNHNDWLFIMQGALAKMRKSTLPGDREAYRDVVVTAAGCPMPLPAGGPFHSKAIPCCCGI